MSCILNIETSTEVCSVAISQEGECIYQLEMRDGLSHATHLAPFVEEALAYIDNHAIPLDIVAVSQGPGSYTGLRIGVSTAKGICYGREVKLVAVPTLYVLCVPVLLRDELPDNALLCPMIDARRMEVYDVVVDRALNVIRSTTADIITEHSFTELLSERPIYFFGNGAEKCKAVLKHSNAHFIDGIVPHAKYMFPLAEKAIAKGAFEDVAYFEPYYLKEFVTTTPKLRT